MKRPNLGLKPNRVDNTSYVVNLTEAQVTEILKQAVCEEAGVHPSDPAVSFKAYISSVGGLSTDKTINCSLVIDHTKQPKAVAPEGGT